MILATFSSICCKNAEKWTKWWPQGQLSKRWFI